MKWLELSVEAPPEFVEPLSHIFYRYGHGGVSVESPAGFNPDEGEFPPVPATLTKRTYIPMDETARERKGNIEVGVKLVSHLYPLEPLIEREIEEEDWESSWKEFFHPLRIGKRIVVCPTWRKFSSGIDDVLVLLDPGMAFGTGHHPTTRMCLELIERIVEGGERVIDLGCGSGLLTITAIKMGARRALALEIDPKAAKIAAENCKVNGVSREITIHTGTLPYSDTIIGQFDIALANISMKVITDLSNPLTQAVRSGGKLILSGILKDGLQDVQNALFLNNVTFDQVLTDGDWTAVLATKS